MVISEKYKPDHRNITNEGAKRGFLWNKNSQRNYSERMAGELTHYPVSAINQARMS